jgi:hypothetical protein
MGDLTEEGVPITQHLEKFDLTDIGGAAYEAAVSLVLSTPWMLEAKEAVVETQSPSNIPARIVAAAIYGALRGKGVKVRFSGAQLKNKAMEELSKRFGCTLTEKPKPPPKNGGVVETDTDKARRRRKMHSVNKDNSKLLATHVLKAVKDDETLAALCSAKGTNGKPKLDDLSDALLLGVGLCLASKTVGNRKQRPTKKRQCRRETDASASTRTETPTPS